MGKKKWVRAAFLVACAIALGAAGVWWHAASMPSGVLQLDGAEIRVAIADTNELRVRGLSGVKGLAEDEGMLFVFDHDDTYAFWMKDMLFPIDIVWLSANGTIVDIAPHVLPSTYPATFQPTSPARFVLELPAHYTQLHNVKVGDKAILP